MKIVAYVLQVYDINVGCIIIDYSQINKSWLGDGYK